MIHQLRICRQASPAVVVRVPGYAVIGWISMPRSPACRLLTEPGARPDSCTPRQNGALLSGWLRARCALLSPGCGSGSVVVVIVVVVPGATTIGVAGPSLGVTRICVVPGGADAVWADAAAAATKSSAASAADVAVRSALLAGVICAARSRSGPGRDGPSARPSSPRRPASIPARGI